MVLVPEIVDAVAPTPVLAAGGIGNGRQVALDSARAQGVWCGSVWLTTLEAKPPGGQGSSCCNVFGHLEIVRELESRLVNSAPLGLTNGKESRRRGVADTSPADAIAHASRQVDRAAMNPENKETIELSNYFVDKIVGSMNESISATRVVEDMITEYLDVMERFDGLNN